MTTHYFEAEIAQKFGILEAVLISHINFWLITNKANGRNFHDGEYWTYNSYRALAEIYPYAKETQIKYALTKLREKGVLKTGNYNKKPYDRTLWYTFTDYGHSIVKNYPMEDKILSNGMEKIV